MEHFLTKQEKCGLCHFQHTDSGGHLLFVRKTFSVVWKDTQMWHTSKQACRVEIGEQTEIYTWS